MVIQLIQEILDTVTSKSKVSDSISGLHMSISYFKTLWKKKFQMVIFLHVCNPLSLGLLYFKAPCGDFWQQPEGGV